MSRLTWMGRSRAAVVARWRRGKRWILRVLTLAWAKFRPLLWPFMVIVLLIGGWLIVQNWDWLSNDVWNWLGAAPNDEVRQETNSTTLRNIGLLVAGLIALPLAVWRSIVAQRQAETAQQGLLNERYQQGAEMLGNDVLTVRLGGIYALQSLGQEHPDQYHVKVVQLFCAFARNPTKDSNLELERTADRPDALETVTKSLEEHMLNTKSRASHCSLVREDVKAVIEAIIAQRWNGIAYEQAEHFRLDLQGAKMASKSFHGANLCRANLSDADLSSAWLINANLSDSQLLNTELSAASLWGANLSGAFLVGANLASTSLSETDLSGSNLSYAKNLTQKQLDEARADPNRPPELEGTNDCESGMPLVWRGKPLDDEA